MDSVKWTSSQSDAIESRDRTLLVSAGAGSGKTSVLTERIVTRLTEGCDLDDFLVVTYTNASAADMKEKLFSKLTQYVTAHPEDMHILQQLEKIGTARVCTIHSFCISLIRQNFSRLNLPSCIRIAGEDESKMILNETLDELAEEWFESANEDFLFLIELASADKSEEKALGVLEKVYQRIRAYPDYLLWFENSTKKAMEQTEISRSEGFFGTEIGKRSKNRIQTELASLCSRFDDLMQFVSDEGLEKHQKAYSVGCELLSELAETVFTTLEEAVSAFDSVKFKNSPSTSEQYDQASQEYANNEYSEIRDEFKKIRSLIAFSEEQATSDYEYTAKVSKSLGTLIVALDERFGNKKRERGLMDFSDTEHYAFRLLSDENGNRTELCKNYSAELTEIFIDEYQDVSPLQDKLFSLLARDDNRFMVGDVKQSIYKFRNAYPDIFINYKDSFPDYPSNSNCARIFLRDNFRCSKSIIDFVNSIFCNICTKERVGFEYAGEELQCGRTDFKGVSPTVALIGATGDAQTRYRTEAEYIASVIKKLKSTYIKENGTPLKYSDVSIMFSHLSYARIYISVLEKNGIPCVSEKRSKLADQPEIICTVSILKAVNSKSDSIASAAAMRSPIYNFSAEDLHLLRRYKNIPLFESACITAALGERKTGRYKFAFKSAKTVSHKASELVTYYFKLSRTELYQKCSRFVNDILFFTERASELTSDALIWLIYTRTGMLSAASADTNGSCRRKNLILFYNYARDYEKISYRGLSAFLRFYAESTKSKDSVAAALAENGDGDAVRIMSIHKSKGLEFPVCFLAQTGVDFVTKELNDTILLRRDMGVFCYRRDPETTLKRSTLMRDSACEREKDELRGEEARKLYVALTRAKELLYIIGTCNFDDDKFESKMFVPFSKANSHLKWILPIVRDTEHLVKIRSLETVDDEMVCISEPQEEESDYSALNKAIEYIYPYAEETKLPEKISVSELRLGILEDDEYTRSVRKSDFSAVPSFASGVARAAEIGIENHIYMQFACFENIDKYGVEAEAKRLINIGMINESDEKLLNYSALRAFFDSELYGRIKASARVYREKRFSLSESPAIFDKSSESDEKILIQGVVDCFFENDDGTYTVVDYKTDRLPKGCENILIERHCSQLRYYCRAVTMMTGKKVTEAYLYSFSLNKAIRVDVI